MNTKKKILILGIGALVIAGVIVFLFYLNSDTVKVNRQLELAQHYLLEEDYEQAIAMFNTIIEIDPKNVDAYIGLAQAYADSGDLESAVKTLEKGYKETNSAELQERKEKRTEELAQIESQQGDTMPDETEADKEIVQIYQAYYDYLSKKKEDRYNDKGASYYFIYLDNDDIPEIYKYGSNRAYGSDLIYYSQGEVKEEWIGKLGSDYIERGGLLYNSDSHDNYRCDIVYRLSNGELQCIASGYFGAPIDDYLMMEYEYWWNDEEVSEEEYNRQLNESFDNTKAKQLSPDWNNEFQLSSFLDGLLLLINQ